MHEYRYNNSFLDYDINQVYHMNLDRQLKGKTTYTTVQFSNPKLWDRFLFRTGDILVNWGERLQKNSASWNLSEECR